MGVHILEPLPFTMPSILKYHGDSYLYPNPHDHIHAFTDTFSCTWMGLC